MYYRLSGGGAVLIEENLRKTVSNNCKFFAMHRRLKRILYGPITRLFKINLKNFYSTAASYPYNNDDIDLF